MWSRKRIAALSLAVGIAVPAALAVGAPNVNSQYGSPGIFGFDFRDSSFPNPGFPDTYGVRRDAFGALRDADMLPDNAVIGHVPGQFQDIGIRKQLPYPYNMGGYESGWYGPFPGTNFPPVGNGYSNSNLGLPNMFSNENAIGSARSMMPNGWFGIGFSGNGVETSTLAAQYGMGPYGTAGDAGLMQPANNFGLATSGFVIQPGAGYDVRNPLAGGASNSGSPANAIAGSPTGNYGIANPLSGSIANSPQISAISPTNFSSVTPVQAANVAASAAVAAGANMPAGQPMKFNVSGPTTNLAGSTIPVGPIGQTNFSRASIAPNGPGGNSVIAGANPQQSQSAPIVATGASNFTQNNAALANSALASPYNISLQPRDFGTPAAGNVPNSVTINSIGNTNFSQAQSINNRSTLAQLASQQSGRSPNFALSGNTDFTAVPPINTNTGVTYATPGRSDFSPIVATQAARNPGGIGGNQPQNFAGTTSNVQTYGNIPSSSPSIASVGNSQFSAVAPGRVQNTSPPIQVNDTIAQGISPGAFAGGYGGGLVPSRRMAQPLRLLPPMSKRQTSPPTYLAPMTPVARGRAQQNKPDHTLAINPLTRTAAAAKSTPTKYTVTALNPRGKYPTTATYRRVQRSASPDGVLASAIGSVTGSMEFDDGSVTVFGTRGTAKHTADQRVVVTLNNGQVFAMPLAAHAVRQIAGRSRSAL